MLSVRQRIETIPPKKLILVGLRIRQIQPIRLTRLALAESKTSATLALRAEATLVQKCYETRSYQVPRGSYKEAFGHTKRHLVIRFVIWSYPRPVLPIHNKYVTIQLWHGALNTIANQLNLSFLGCPTACLPDTCVLPT